MKGMKWIHFMIILLLDPYFKINCWIYRGILGVLVKKSLNNFGRNENEWNVSNPVWEQHGENGMESFYDNITIRPLF